MSNVAEVLEKAAELIDRTGWTQEAYARDRDGEDVNERDERAVCYCAKGAMFFVAGYRADVKRALQRVLPPPPNGETCPIAMFNDAPGRTQAEVVAKLREAAALAREQGK